MSLEGEETVAKVTITTTENGETNVEEKTFRGTKAEVETQIQQL
jgi:K(+)-stimulated pyrophosphate-energized sodium pump